MSKPSYKALRELINIDSPTGYTRAAAGYCANYLSGLGYKPRLTRKGAVRCSLSVHKPVLTLAAHVDTLGGIVEELKSDGTLRISSIGGYPPNSFEGTYLRIYTMQEEVYTGTLLLNNPSAHANKEVSKKERTLKNMHVRLDAKVKGRDDLKELGVRVGDFVCFEPHYEELASGYIKSRFLDNKSGCYILFEVARRLKESSANRPVELYFSNYEEVGHGGSGGYSASIEELLVIDMGVVGEGVAGDEAAVSICAKDSSGPYDYAMRSKLVHLAEKHSIPHHISIYPFYGSDGSAALRAGLDVRVGLIGPGVSASHGVERTHREGIEATIELCMAYIHTVDPRP